jgi:4-hydroxy-2-oxoheptanedioate aldolase
MGPAGQDKLDEAILTITETSLRAGRPVGIFRPTTDDIADWASTGISFFILASDTMYLGAAVASQATNARKFAIAGLGNK